MIILRMAIALPEFIFLRMAIACCEDGGAIAFQELMVLRTAIACCGV
jgi:hypothetical protein